MKALVCAAPLAALAPALASAQNDLRKKLPHDGLKDFEPVSLIASAPLLVVVHPSLARGIGEGGENRAPVKEMS